jgi:hypothetical protein
MGASVTPSARPSSTTAAILSAACLSRDAASAAGARRERRWVLPERALTTL